jgi:hypothetical protein
VAEVAAKAAVVAIPGIITGGVRLIRQEIRIGRHGEYMAGGSGQGSVVGASSHVYQPIGKTIASDLGGVAGGVLQRLVKGKQSEDKGKAVIDVEQ